jgi:hypothetical protein
LRKEHHGSGIIWLMLFTSFQPGERDRQRQRKREETIEEREKREEIHCLGAWLSVFSPFTPSSLWDGGAHIQGGYIPLWKCPHRYHQMSVLLL